jgi:hypothetical protein
MQAADAEDEHIRSDGSEGIGRRGTHQRVRLLCEHSAENGDVDVRVVCKRDRDRRTVRDDRRLELRREVARDLQRRRARVEQDHLAVPEQTTRRSCYGGLCLGRLLEPIRVRPIADGCGQRAAVNPPKKPCLLQLAEVAADGVRRHCEGRAQLRGDHLAVASEPVEDQLSAFLTQHAIYSSISVQFRAISRSRLCTTSRVDAFLWRVGFGYAQLRAVTGSRPAERIEPAALAERGR